MTDQDAARHVLAAITALCPAALAEEVSALSIDAGFEDGIAARTATRNELRRAHALPVHAVFTRFAARASAAFFGGTTAYSISTALFGGATASAISTALFAGAAANVATRVMGCRTTVFWVGEGPPRKQGGQRGAQYSRSDQLQRLNPRNGAASQPFGQLIEGVLPPRAPWTENFSKVVISCHCPLSFCQEDCSPWNYGSDLSVVRPLCFEYGFFAHAREATATKAALPCAITSQSSGSLPPSPLTHNMLCR